MNDFQFTSEEIYTCPAEALANLLGRKRVPQIIKTLAIQDTRFLELVRQLDGSTPKMIKQQLDLLIANEIVKNEKVTIQNSVESTHQLTTKGRELFQIVKQMKQWGQSNLIFQL
ncbi:winged helix-turn-helix transcriptional regulator [Enterococcus cecorum]